MAKYKDFDDDLSFVDESNIEEEISEPAIKRYSGNVKYKKKNNKRWILILVIVLQLVLIIGLLGVWYVVKKISLVNNVRLDETKIIINEDLDKDTKEVLSGYTNILLLGTDSRDNSVEAFEMIKQNHTDAILVASINNDTKEVRIMSVYRDCLLEMGNWDSKENKLTYSEINKATEGVFYYGIEAAITMINRNLDMDINDFVMINWSSLIEIVNAVGGVDIEINLIEQRWLNRYLVDTSESTGVQYTEVTAFEDDGKLRDEEISSNAEMMATKKMVHMDGIQATSFARVRYGDGKADYGRTERQRKVISEIVSKAKNLKNFDSTLTAILKNVYTSMETSEILKMAPSVLKYKLNMIDGGFPMVKNDQIESKNGWNFSSPVIPVTLESNVKEFHRILFDDEKYEPSTTVKNISEKIATLTGVRE